MAKRKSGRDVHGLILLDKRLGVSSNQALQEVKRLFNANKAGHTGSLDPAASGLLPLCFGEATKVSALMLDHDKRYRVMIRLGVRTDTGDAEGQVIAEMTPPVLSEDAILSCLRGLTGEIEQTPPMYSALKHQGKKLYELARAGQTVERSARRIRIYQIQLLHVTADMLELDVHCSKGTYIRTLAEDIAAGLGTVGSVAALRRTAVGTFDIAQAYRYEQLAQLDQDGLDSLLLKVDTPLAQIPAVNLDPEQAKHIVQGRQIAVDPASVRHNGEAPEQPWPGTVRIYLDEGFLGLGEMLLNGKLAPRKLFNLPSAIE